MILAFDTYYFDQKAKTVCLEFQTWTDNKIVKVHSEILENIAEYKSGEFYKRELPCILSLLKKIDLEDIEAIIIDGYVILDDEGKFGLGGHLYDKLDKLIPIIGVAKSNFATVKEFKKPLLRGKSNNPLYITSIGIDVNEAAEKISEMCGSFRIPTLLKELDRLTKEKQNFG